MSIISPFPNIKSRTTKKKEKLFLFFLIFHHKYFFYPLTPSAVLKHFAKYSSLLFVCNCVKGPYNFFVQTNVSRYVGRSRSTLFCGYKVTILRIQEDNFAAAKWEFCDYKVTILRIHSDKFSDTKWQFCRSGTLNIDHLEYHILSQHSVTVTEVIINTICPGSSDPFYIVTYCINLVTTSWTHSKSFRSIHYKL